MISSELPEILRMSHRIIVMCEGRHAPVSWTAATATQEQIMTFATQRGLGRGGRWHRHEIHDG